MPLNDLLIKAKLLADPASGDYGGGAIGVTDGRITFSVIGPIESDIPPARKTVDISDGIVLPGLVDLHVHPALSNSRFGVDPDRYLLTRGSTTVLSQGDAGARNVDEYVQQTISTSKITVKLGINFCANGESNPSGRFFSLDEASVSECVASIRRARPHIWGISLNIALIRGKGIDPLEIMRRGIRAAEETGLPVMFGATKSSEVPLADQLSLLRPGDVMTYCFHSGEGSIVENGQLLDCVWEARERGILFDVGDGFAAFGFDVAETAIAEGFLPDTISSDFYRQHVISGIEHDLPLVVSKLVASGMSAEQCWPRVTSVPANILGLTGVGTLQEGASADICVLKPGAIPESLRDGHGRVREGKRWRPVSTYKTGNLIETSSVEGE